MNAYKISEDSFAAVFTDISQQKTMELAFKQERDLFTAGPVFTITWGPTESMPVTFVSENVQHILGYTNKEMTADTFAYLDLIHAEDLARVQEEMVGYIKDGTRNYEQSFRLRTSVGEYRWFYSFTQLIRDDDAQLTAINGYLFDQTAHKLADKALRENENFLRNIFDSIQDGLTVLDPDLTIRLVNPTMERWHEQQIPLIGRPCHKVYRNSDAPCTPCPSLRALKSGQMEMEVIPGRPGSSLEWFELFAYSLVDRDSGEVSGVIEFLRDITDRKRAEEKLADERWRLTSIIESTNTGTWEWHVQTGAFVVNEIWAKIVGYTLEELTPINAEAVGSLIHPDDLLRVAELIQLHVKGKLPIFGFVHRIRHKDGRWVHSDQKNSSATSV